MSDCPRCGRSPVEVSTFGERESTGRPACACYPPPPLCISGRSVLTDDGRCDDMACAVYDAIQPDPITDPLWGTR